MPRATRSRHGVHDGRGRVAGEHRHVGDVEVGVLVAVDVAEVRAAALVDEQRRMVVRRAEPRHGHAVRHDGLRSLPQLPRATVAPGEHRVLAGLDLLQLAPGDPDRLTAHDGTFGAVKACAVPASSPT